MKPKVLLLALLAQLFILSASAYDAVVNGIYYNLDLRNKTASVTYKEDLSESTYSGSITIPTNITYDNVSYKVTAIGRSAFSRDEDLTSVSIPSSITSIEAFAFSSCTSLRSINIPASVTEIGGFAFSGCSSLTSINIPSSVTIIEYKAFDGTPWYDSWYAVQSDGPCYMNSVLFTYKGKEAMPSNTSIVVRDGTTCIASDAFLGCSNLISIEIPQSVNSICSRAFWGCGLKAISLPSSLEYLGSNAFVNCKGLTEIEIPAFTKVGGHTSYRIGGWFDTMSFAIFGGCTNLTSALLAEGKIKVDEGMFEGCTNLTTVTLPSTITSIGGRAFQECNNLSTVKAKMRTPPSIGSEIFTNRFLATLIVPEGCKAAYEAADYWNEFKEIKEESEPAPDPLDNFIYLEKTDGFVGQELTLSFQMKNSAAIRGFQFDLYLPDGVTAVKNAKGRIQGALSSGRLPEEDEHTLTIQEQADEAIRFLCSSLYDETFTGTSGEIATLQVMVGENMEEGDYPVIIKNMKLTETNISNYYETSYLESTLTISAYTPGDVNGDTKVDVSDYTGVANRILGIAQDVFIEKAGDVDGSGTIDVSDYTGIANYIMTGSFSGRSNLRKVKGLAAGSGENVIYLQDEELPVAEASGAEVELSIRMRNAADIRGFQFDMYLPEGFTVVKNNKGRITASLSSGRRPEGDEHTLTVQEQADGAIRFLCSSLYDETFTGTDGEIATVKVKIAENITAGDYTIQLKNMKLTETNISNYYETELMESVFRVTGGEEPIVCAKPTISYANGKLTFSSETEGAVCQSTITDADIASYSTNEVQLGVTYNISVYATKEGYQNSEVATATLCWIDQQPDTEGIIDEDAVAEVKALPVLIQTQGGTITVQGTAEGTLITVYDINGRKYGATVSGKDYTTIATSLQPGSVAIVKIGEKSVKVMVK